MLSERRIAQFGLGSACLMLATTLAILYQGSWSTPARPAGNGSQVVSRDTRQPPSDPHATAKIASLAK